MIYRSFKDNVMKLNELDKVKLIEMLSDSLENPSSEVKSKWAKESEMRYRLFKQGKSKAIPLSILTREYIK